MKHFFTKNNIIREIRFIGRKAFGASIVSLVFVAVAGTSLWALAAFTEPSAGPTASVQDFAKNIMGANNADNGFDSGSVVANNDGSLVERAEYLATKTGSCYNVGLSYNDSNSSYTCYSFPTCATGYTRLTTFDTNHRYDPNYYKYFVDCWSVCCK